MTDHDTLRSGLATAASAVGKGLLAGLVGTAVMTLSQRLVTKLEDDGGGSGGGGAPAEAVEKALDVEPEDQQAEKKLAQLAHWAVGTGWGAARGLIGATGLREPGASAAHFALVWGGAVAMLPALGLSKPITEWSPKQIAEDVLHHAVYAAATGAVYDWLDGGDG